MSEVTGVGSTEPEHEPEPEPKPKPKRRPPAKKKEADDAAS